MFVGRLRFFKYKCYVSKERLTENKKIKRLDGCKYVTYIVRADFNYLFFVGNGFMFSHQKSHRTIFHKKKTRFTKN